MRPMAHAGVLLLAALGLGPATGLAGGGHELTAGDLILRGRPHRALAPARSSGSPAAELVQVDLSLLESGVAALWLELTPGERLLAYRTGIERNVWGDVVWRGRFADGDPAYSGITLSLHGGVLVGSLQTPEGRAYRLDPHPSGSWELRLDSADSFSCGVGMEPTEPPTADEVPAVGEDSTAAAANAGRRLGILIVHTAAAAQELGGREAFLARAHHNVDRLNSAFVNSGIDGQAVLVGVEEVDLGWVVLSLTRAMQLAQRNAQVQALRDGLGADVVSVVISDEEAAGCGQAMLMKHHLVGPQMAPLAYNAFNPRCFTGGTFVHETGHVLGAQHNVEIADSPTEAAYPFSFAHAVDSKLRTIMAYASACHDTCPLYEVFSNPLRAIDGEPTGIPDQRDNALTLNLTIPIAAAFRTTEPVPVPSLPTGKPARPSKLVVELFDLLAVLSWKDNARNETAYLIEVRRPRSTRFVSAMVLEPGTTSAFLFLVNRPGVYRFRVVAVSGTRRSPPSNVALVRVAAP